MAIFYSYVKLPEGILFYLLGSTWISLSKYAHIYNIIYIHHMYNMQIFYIIMKVIHMEPLKTSQRSNGPGTAMRSEIRYHPSPQ